MKSLYVSIYALAIVQIVMLQILDSELLLFSNGFLLYGLEYLCIICLSFFIIKRTKTIKKEQLLKVSTNILITQSTVFLYNITWSILVCRITHKLEWYYDRLHNDNIYLSPPPLLVIISLGVLSVFYISFYGHYVIKHDSKQRV